MAKGLKKWIMRLKGGDQSAFLPFYEKTAPGLLRFLLWKTGGDHPTSEDILQEAYVRFLLNLDRLEMVKDEAIYAYMLKIVKNCWIDKVGRSPEVKRKHVSIESLGEIPDMQQSMKQEQAVELRELSIAMESLNEKESEIIWLRDALGMSHREVAGQFGITEQASRQAYVRAKKSLMTELAESWLPVTESGGAYATTELS